MEMNEIRMVLRSKGKDIMKATGTFNTDPVKDNIDRFNRLNIAIAKQGGGQARHLMAMKESGEVNEEVMRQYTRGLMFLGMNPIIAIADFALTRMVEFKDLPLSSEEKKIAVHTLIDAMLVMGLSTTEGDTMVLDGDKLHDLVHMERLKIAEYDKSKGVVH